jgi:hypothetical protein
MSITKLLRNLGLCLPSVEKQVSDYLKEVRPFQTQSRPFEWDRPMEGLYAEGQIRILWNDKAGNLEYCRLATDEEVRFITLYEKIEEMTIPLKAHAINRDMMFKAMADSGFARTSSCCDRTLDKMCQGDEYRGNLEGFVGTLLRLAGLKK